MLALLHLSLEGITVVDTDPKGRFVSFKVTPSNDRVLCVYAHSRYITREQLAKGRFFEGLQNYMENKNKGNENKKLLGDLIVLWIKWTGMVKIKHKNFIGAAPVMPCENSSWIMSLRIYGEGRIQISQSSPATIGPLERTRPLVRAQNRQGLY